MTTTAKLSHAWEYRHDALGYNYRLPNVNAALGCAQITRLADILADKRRLAGEYARAFAASGVDFVTEPADCASNYWLNAVLTPDRQAREPCLPPRPKPASSGGRPERRCMRLPCSRTARAGNCP